MRSSLFFASVAVLALLAPRHADAAAEFKFGIIGCPLGPIEGAPGSVVTRDFVATLETTGIESADGPEGWSLSIAVEGATVKAVAVEGVLVRTLFDEDEEASTPLANVPFDLGTADLQVAQKATGDYAGSTIAGKSGVVSTIVLNNAIKRVLRPNVTHQILKFTLDIAIPDSEAGTEVVLSFLDGLKGLDEIQGTDRPVKNVVTFNGAPNPPETSECRFRIQKFPTPPFHLFVVPKGKAVADVPVEGENGVFAETLRPGVRELELFVNLTSQEIVGGEGPQGWSLSVASEACAPVSALTLKGVIVETLFNDDEDPTTPLTNVPLDLGTADFKVAQRSTGDYPDSPIPGIQGVTSAIVLNNTIKRVLRPNASDNVLSIKVKVNVVLGLNPDCRLFFIDGLQHGKPVRNVVTFRGTSHRPQKTQGLILRLTGEADPKANFIRGDANSDGRVDLSDVIWTLRAVVPGLSGPPTPCRDAGDSNDDDAMNLTDAVYTLNWLLRGGPKPPAPGGSKQRECGSDDDSTDASCPRGSTSCPPRA